MLIFIFCNVKMLFKYVGQLIINILRAENQFDASEVRKKRRGREAGTRSKGISIKGTWDHSTTLHLNSTTQCDRY